MIAALDGASNTRFLLIVFFHKMSYLEVDNFSTMAEISPHLKLALRILAYENFVGRR